MDWLRRLIKRERPILFSQILESTKISNKKSRQLEMENSHRQESWFSLTCIFIGITLFFTTVTAACLSLSLLTDHWETITFKQSQVKDVANSSRHSVTWVSKQLCLVYRKRDDFSQRVTRTSSSANIQQQMSNNTDSVIYLMSLHGGVNNICTDLSDEERSQLLVKGFSPPGCLSYLTPEGVIFKNSWLARMRNLAMSCSMVSLILIGACALVGSFGLVKREISAVMVTGVMLFLAALFGLFTLSFMYFKRMKPDGVYTSTIIDQGIPIEYLRAREFTMGWSASLGWVGIILCIISSTFWLLLARVLRYQLFSVT